MYTLEEIDKELIQSDNPNLPESFVAAAVKVDNAGIAHHAGLVISTSGKYYLFHYTGEIVILDIVPNGKWYFHKNLSFITNEEVLAFYAHCKIISTKANPSYGYFYSGSYYTEEGQYFSESGIPEFMTCVGFCINVVLGFIESDEYFVYSDWSEDSVKNAHGVFANHIDYFNWFISQPNVQGQNIDIQLFKENLRRINPAEYVASAYLEIIPIRKKAIDEIIANVEAVIEHKRINSI